ncbi:MAG: patatin-like phospholipase family protein [Ignavibacteriales bacterium]
MDARGRKVGLALGAGSARGLAHIGILQVLNENKIPYDFIVGSSMGAMVGAIYASGADLYMAGKMLDIFDYKVLWDVGIPRMGFISGNKIEKFIRLLTKNRTFDQLDIPLAVVTTNILTGEKVVINEGLVADAVRASVSIPGVFRPVRHNDLLLVDGAVAERLPVQTARDMGAEIVLGVDVTFAAGKTVKLRNTLDVFLQAIDVLEHQIFENISRHQADLLIQASVGHIGSSEFDKAAECIELGRKCAEDALGDIKALLGMEV